MGEQSIEPSGLYETRASLYWWFSTLLTRELDEDQLARYTTGEGKALLDDLAEDPKFSPSVDKINKALAQIGPMEHPALELAADFTELFLMDAKAGASPYASVYQSDGGLLFQKPHDDMVALLKSQGLAVEARFNEPADHIAIQLDYLGNLIIKEGNQVSPAQATFIEQHLLSWVPQFVKSTDKVKNTGFYQGVCQLMLDFIELDHEEILAS